MQATKQRKREYDALQLSYSFRKQELETSLVRPSIDRAHDLPTPPTSLPSSRNTSYPSVSTSGRSAMSAMSEEYVPQPHVLQSLERVAEQTQIQAKKYKCPYCDIEFTRHHNLKSHLLIHSREKPYVCQTCNLRFRRLHDLKRHGKLHTGEKPHVCPKCNRKFARGDAFNRHLKGPCGLHDRRASVESIEEEDASGEDLDMMDDIRRGPALPAASTAAKSYPKSQNMGSPDANRDKQPQSSVPPTDTMIDCTQVFP